MSEFYHLHIHNEHSQLDGLGTAEQYAEEASRLGFKYLGITNHGNVDGNIKFQKACEAKDIKVIHGCELYVVDNRHSKEKGEKRYHLTVFVKNKYGWENLLQILTIANVEGYYRRPRADVETILKYSEGLIFASACSSSFINAEWGEKFLVQLKELVAGDVYLEIMPHDTPEQKQTNILACSLSKKYNIPLLATNDCHYPKASGAKAQEVLLAIQSKAKWKDPERWRFNVIGLYLKTQEEMELAFEHQNAVPSIVYRRALANTKHVVGKCCDFKIERLPVILPKVPGYEDRDETELLRELTELGYRKCILNRKERINRRIYRERIEEEFELICKLGFQRYFLIVWELINWSKKNDILVGVGRGSSGSSLIAFLLGITGVDPLKYGLLFSRFISPARCFVGDTKIIIDDLVKNIEEAKIGDSVINKYGERDRIKTIRKFRVEEKLLKIYFNDKHVICTKDHKWIVSNKGNIIEKQAKDLVIGEDKLIKIQM